MDPANIASKRISTVNILLEKRDSKVLTQESREATLSVNRYIILCGSLDPRVVLSLQMVVVVQETTPDRPRKFLANSKADYG